MSAPGRMLRILACLWLVAGAASAERAIGVAPFQRVAAEGQGVPDIASRLAQRLSTRGVEKVVGPAELGAEGGWQPAAEDVAKWGAASGVDSIVVGRTTRVGSSLAVDARLLDAATGVVLGAPMVEEISQPAELGRAIEGLADQVITRIESDPLRPVSSRPPEPTAAGSASAPASSKRDTPISIQADELEALEQGGKKKFVFTGNVRAKQGDLLLRSRRLEAFYPPGASQADRLVATGRVVLEQTGRIAHCKKAVYHVREQRMVCTGDLARLEQECDLVQGREITFHLDTEVLHVTGAADVKLRPEGEQGCGASATTAKAPSGSGG